jgi:hypothetical protein
MKIKIDNRIWLIIGIAVFVAAAVILFRTYTQEVNEQAQLTTDLAAQQALLHMLTTEEEDQQNKLNAAESLLETSRAKFPESVESIEYGEDFFKIAYGQDLYAMAAGCGVELTSLTASQPTARAAGAVTYAVSSFGVVVNGNIDDILKFIDAIGTGIDYELPWSFQLPWSADVNSVSIDIGGEEGVATISVDIYGYKGT